MTKPITTTLVRASQEVLDASWEEFKKDNHHRVPTMEEIMAEIKERARKKEWEAVMYSVDELINGS